MWQQPEGCQLPPRALAMLGELELKVKAAPSADRLWQIVLTEADRQQLGGDLQECYSRYGTFGMWAELKGVSKLRALIEVGRKLGFLDDTHFRWLIREIGEEDQNSTEPGRPRWDRKLCELRFEGRLIKKVRGPKVARNIVALLDAFEEEGWPPHIFDPLRAGPNPKRLQDTVESLNVGLEEIRFHAG